MRNRVTKSTHPISRIDAVDSRLIKKEFLRLIRFRVSILRSLCESDQTAIDIAKSGANQKDDGFESDIEGLIWKYVAIQLEIDLAEAKKAATDTGNDSKVTANPKTSRKKYSKSESRES